jgi:pyruvate kinase
MLRRTKIVATLGPATDDLAELDRVIQNGLDVARVNFSHGSRADHERRVREVRERARVHDRYVGVLVDLQGPKIRIEGFRDGAATLADGDSFVLDTRLGPRDGDASRVGVSYRNLLRDVSVGDVLLLDDGNVVMEVTAVVNEAVHCRVINGGHLSDNKGLNRQGGGLSAAALTAKDEQDIQLAAELAADFMAVSFVRDAADVQRARDLLRAAGSRGKIVAQVERAEAIEHVEESIDAADVVMIARGDLGVEIGDAELPGMQKSVIRQARACNRVTITATQMMQSMVDSPQPTRAEVLDVANAVMDGTDAVMLSAETAIGKHPGRVIKAMDRICRGAERQRSTMISTHRIDARFENVEEAIAMASMYTANHFEVRAIVAMTESGATAKWMSRISSGIPIVAMTSQEATLRRVTLYRGVYPIRLDIDDATSAEAEREILDELRRLGFVEEGESVIMTRGELTGVAGGTNSMKILLV